MGTNYYHHRNICDCCGRPEAVKHIGKSSSGWTFTFQGTPQIRSYEQWLDVLAEGGEILNEYGDRISLEEFRQMVADKGKEQHNHATEYRQGTWLDESGHAFLGFDFS